MNNLETIKKILDSEYERGKADGLATGFSVAHRIFVRYAANHKLVDPHSPEQLEQWGRADLEELKAKLSKEV